MKTEQNTVENQIETSQKPAETIHFKKFNLLKFTSQGKLIYNYIRYIRYIYIIIYNIYLFSFCSLLFPLQTMLKLLRIFSCILKKILGVCHSEHVWDHFKFFKNMQKNKANVQQQLFIRCPRYMSGQMVLLFSES